MKHWYRTLPCKVICFILCIVSLCVTVASIAGAALMIAGEFYVLPKEYVLASHHESMLRSESNNILWHHIDEKEYHYCSINDYDPDITNVRYSVVSPEDKVIGTNSESQTFDFSFKWIYYKDKDGNYTVVDYYFEGAENSENADIFTVNMSVNKNYPVKDQYFLSSLLINAAYALLYWIYPIGLFSLALCVTCIVILMTVSGRRPDSDELHPGPLYRVPIDLFIAVLVAFYIFAIFLVCDAWYTGELLMWVLIGIVIALAANTLLGLCMSIATRIKGKTLFKNTLIWIILKLIGRGIKYLYKAIASLVTAIPLIWRTFLFVLGNIILDLMFLCMAYSWDYYAFLLWTLKTLCVIPVVIYGAIMLRRLEKGGKAIAKGDLSYRIDTKTMLWDFKKHAENLNSISGGMAKAVEERLKSERMKTELITNVSHDIKTPITSIINYSSLIAKEGCDCKKHLEYSEVLVRKSEHLKHLLDDLVEVSKATTGNLDVSLSPCEAGVLLSQAAGEFEERCASCGLELIWTLPEAPIRIMADPRRIWRVFENLMGNACKYSLTASRVYLSLEKKGDNAVITIKNTSRSPLNISPQELTQRFIRGDSSRTTEGNGLGLSIAESLTELQGGKMNITIDGDLFKVTLSFPVI